MYTCMHRHIRHNKHVQIQTHLDGKIHECADSAVRAAIDPATMTATIKFEQTNTCRQIQKYLHIDKITYRL
jgi:hypothetical protein